MPVKQVMIPGGPSAIPREVGIKMAISTQNCLFVKKKNKNVPYPALVQEELLDQSPLIP